MDPPPQDEEYDAASSLLLLSESGGGFCNSTAANQTITPEQASSIKIETQKRGMTVHKGKAAARVHECSVCHEIFGTGKALGGHMRKHLDTSKLASTSASTGPITDFNRPPPE